MDDEKPSKKSGAVARRHEKEIPPRTSAVRSVQLLTRHAVFQERNCRRLEKKDRKNS